MSRSNSNSDGGERMMSMDPVVELSGEISEVEDVSTDSVIMQGSESSMSLYDEDENGEGGLAVMKADATGDAQATLPPWLAKANASASSNTTTTKKRKQQRLALAATLIMVVAGCGYLVLSGELDSSSSNNNSNNGATKKLDDLSAFNTPGTAYTVASSTTGSSTGDTNDSHSTAPTHSVALSSAAMLQSGSAFRIELASSNKCLDTVADSASALATNSNTSLVFAECVPERPSQTFVYDPFNTFVMSAMHAGSCIDSSTVTLSLNSILRPLQLVPCGAEPVTQLFEFAAATATLVSTHYGLCVTSSNHTHTAATLERCRHDRTQQQRLRLTPVTDKRRKSPSNPKSLHDDQFLLQSVGKHSLCMESSETPTGFAVQVARCGASSGGQRFTYNASMQWIQSAVRPELCLDDNGAWAVTGIGTNIGINTGTNTGAVDDTRVKLTACSTLSYTQQFVFDDRARTVRSAAKPLLCLDDGGGFFPGTTSFRMAQCDLAAGNQQFQRVLRSALHSVPPATLLAPSTPQRTFVIESVYRALCVTTRFRLQPCDAQDMAELSFQYDSAHQTIQSAATASPLLCWTHSEPPTSTFGIAFVSLELCDTQSTRQRFVFDEAVGSLRSGTGLCLDDGGGWFAGETPLALIACDAQSARQRFQLRAAM